MAEEYLRLVAQAYLSLGPPDPRVDNHGKTGHRIARMYAAYKKTDKPPKRVKPVPLVVLRRIVRLAGNSPKAPTVQVMADLIVIAFFFLLRPGEYCADTGAENTCMFEFKDVQLFYYGRRLNLTSDSDATLLHATSAALTIEYQKNGRPLEVIGHKSNAEPFFNPARAIARCIIRLRNNAAAPNTPLCTVFRAGHPTTKVTSSMITKAIKEAVCFMGGIIGISSEDVTARSLHASGANALLCAGVDTDIIRLLGRWRSDR